MEGLIRLTIFAI